MSVEAVQDRIIWVVLVTPIVLAVKPVGTLGAVVSGGAIATVCPEPPAIAVTLLKPVGIVVWPLSLNPHATIVPSFFKATV